MKNIFKAFPLLIALVVAHPSSATTTYVIGVEDISYLPHYTMDEGEYRGYARDILDSFAASRDIQFEYRALPVTRLFQSLVSGEIDFKYPDSPYWNPTIKEGKHVAYSAPIAPYVDGVMVRSENLDRGPINVQTLGTVRGFTPYAWLGHLAKGEVTLRENPSFSGLLRQTIAGRVDGAYVNVSVARYFLRFQLEQAEALVFEPILPHVRDNYFISTTKHAALIDELNRWLQEQAEFVVSKQKEWGII